MKGWCSIVTYEELKQKHQTEFETFPMLFAYGDEQFKQVMEKLPDSLREPFLLSYGNDLPHKDIAAFLNINENAVAVRIHRAKKKIAEMLREEEWA